MLKMPFPQRGFTIIEILISMTVLAILISLGAPSFGEWLQNQQIRAAADAIVNGMQVARGEAIKRNLPVQMVVEPPAAGWTVCEATVDPCDSTTSLIVTPPLVIQSRSAQEGTSNANITTSPAKTTAVTFSPLGNVIRNSDGTPPLTQIDVINVRGACSAQSGTMRCLRVVVTGGGSIRMCDPTPGIVAPDPRACP